MKYKPVLLFSLFLVHSVLAQIPSNSFTIEGDIVKPVQISASQLSSYSAVILDSLRIYGHDMTPRSLMKNIKGVLLKDILGTVPFNNENPKVLSAYFIECEATDGYKVLFSWNEIFNSETGNHVMIVTEKNGSTEATQEDRMVLISPSDIATGRRYVKWLSRIIIHRVKE